MAAVGRVFAAVPLPALARASVADAVEGLSLPGSPVPIENLHITLRFLGDVDEVTYERFLHSFQAVEALNAFTVGIDGFGAFPNNRRATVLWLGVVAGGRQLRTLNKIAEESAVVAGLAPEERPYEPHLTISRLRPHEDVRQLLARPASARWRVDTVVVYRSHLGSGKARYEPLEHFSLRN